MQSVLRAFWRDAIFQFGGSWTFFNKLLRARLRSATWAARRTTNAVAPCHAHMRGMPPARERNRLPVLLRYRTILARCSLSKLDADCLHVTQRFVRTWSLKLPRLSSRISPQTSATLRFWCNVFYRIVSRSQSRPHTRRTVCGCCGSSAGECVGAISPCL